jgi:hypothetical protein
MAYQGLVFINCYDAPTTMQGRKEADKLARSHAAVIGAKRAANTSTRKAITTAPRASSSGRAGSKRVKAATHTAISSRQSATDTEWKEIKRRRYNQTMIRQSDSIPDSPYTLFGSGPELDGAREAVHYCMCSSVAQEPYWSPDTSSKISTSWHLAS